MSGIFGGSKSSSKPVDLRDPALATPTNQFASLLLGLLGAEGPQTGQVRGPGTNPTATINPTPVGTSSGIAGIPGFQGQFTAPITGAEQNILAGLQGEGAGRQDFLAQTLSGQFLTPGSNPFLQQFSDAANRTTMRQFEEMMTRTLPGRFTQAGQNINPGQSSAFDRAAAIQSEGLANALADTNSRIFAGAYESERARQQEAAQISQQEVDTTIKNLQAQALPRLIEQFGLDQGLAEFQRQTQMLIQVLSILQGVSAPAMTSESKSKANPDISQAIGGAATGAALAAG